MSLLMVLYDQGGTQSQAKLAMQWWDIYVQVPESMSDAVSECLQRLGSSAVVVHDQAVLSPQPGSCPVQDAQVSRWTVLQGALAAEAALPTQLSRLQQCIAACAQGDFPFSWKLYCRQLQESAYLTQWQHFFPPLFIGEHLLIRPSWDTSALPDDRPALTLDPGLAFGTGTHPTTYMCLTLLTRYGPQYQGKTLLDVGCGSGILSLAAVHMGLSTAVGVDIDAQAVTVAADNAVLNNLQESVQFRQGSWEAVTGRFAVITANIYLGPLVEMLPPLTRRLAAQGTLILSGIVEHQEATLVARLSSIGLTVAARLAQEGWVALAAQRST